MPIEAESPEQFGYDRIPFNLAESSVSDAQLGSLDVQLDELVLMYGDHLGRPGLRAASASDGAGLDADDVLVTPGAAGALFIIATSHLGAGDRVIVARPNYATNLETPWAIGAELVPLDLAYGEDWAVDPARIASLMTPETVSLTNPHNPTSSTIPEASLNAIIRLVEAHPTARLLIDETYREMTYGGSPSPVAAISERAISVGSLSKTYGLPGIRIGWPITRDRELRDQFLAAKEQILITNSVVDEVIAEAVMARRAERLPAILTRIESALDTTRASLASDPRFEWIEPSGGVVGFPRIRPAGRTWSTEAAARFHRILLDEHGTVVGPGHWFGQPPEHFRLGFGWPAPDELAGGLQSLSNTLTETLAATVPAG